MFLSNPLEISPYGRNDMNQVNELIRQFYFTLINLCAACQNDMNHGIEHIGQGHIHSEKNAMHKTGRISNSPGFTLHERIAQLAAG